MIRHRKMLVLLLFWIWIHTTDLLDYKNTSVAEPRFFWVTLAPAPGGQGPGANSGCNLLGLVPAPAPGIKRRLQVVPPPA